MISRERRLPTTISVNQSQTMRLIRGPFKWFWIVVLVTTIVLAPSLLSEYWLHVLNLALIAIPAAIALNLLTGTTGLVSLGQAAFLATGGFAAAWMTLTRDIPFLVVLVVAALFGGLLGLVVGVPSLRLRALYVAVTTLALQYGVILLIGVYQASAVRASGFVLPFASIGPYELRTTRDWFFLLTAIAIISVLGATNLTRSFVGRRWVSVAKHDIVAEALGVSPARAKISAFVATSAVVSTMGAISAYYIGVFTSESYDLRLSIAYLAMIIVGGIGRVLGSVLGAFTITFLPYLLERMLSLLGIDIGSGTLGGLHLVVYGLLIVGFLLFEPRGFVELWRRLRNRVELWPFKYRPMGRSTR